MNRVVVGLSVFGIGMFAVMAWLVAENQEPFALLAALVGCCAISFAVYKSESKLAKRAGIIIRETFTWLP